MMKYYLLTIYETGKSWMEMVLKKTRYNLTNLKKRTDFKLNNANKLSGSGGKSYWY